MSSINLAVPFFSQRENTYVWYQCDEYGNRLKDKNGKEKLGISMAWCSCNITSLCMILHYFGITDDSPDDMLRKVYEVYFPKWRQEIDNSEVTFSDFEGKNWNQRGGTYRLEYAENMMAIAHELYGVPYSQINIKRFNLENCIDLLKNGYPVWFSCGVLKEKETSGHISVLRGFIEKNNGNIDGFIINDSWGDPTSVTGKLNLHNTNIRSYSTKTGYDYFGEAGAGIGDNVVVEQSHFKKVVSDPLHVSLVIKPSKIWSLPVKTTYLNPLEENETEEMREKTISDIMFEKENYRGKNTINFVKHGFPLCENGFWDDGIHLMGVEEQNVYPIGPGQIVAVRNSKKNNNKYNFVLIKHTVPVSKGENYFYSFYMHLADIDFKKRLSEKFSFGQVQKENRDWVDQIIDHLMPKKAFISIKSPADGNELNEIKVYSHISGNDFHTKLSDRSIVYLCPKLEEDKKLLIDLNCDNESKINQVIKKLNDILTYEYSGNITGGIARLKIFTKVRTTTKYTNSKENIEYIWEEGYIDYDVNKIHVQEINVNEYRFYRKKLKDIIDGKIVTFFDITDSDIKVKEEDWRDILRRKINLMLPLEKRVPEKERNKENIFNALTDYYKSFKNEHLKDLYWEIFSTNYLRLAIDLLSYPAQFINEVFTYRDKTFTKQMKESYTKIFKIYKSNNDIDGENSWNNFYSSLSIYCYKNADVFLEANSNTPIGKFGKYDSLYQIYYEIFSPDNIVRNSSTDDFDRYYILKPDNFYNKENAAITLLNANIENIDSEENMPSLIDNIISPKELYTYYTNNHDKFLHMIAFHQNSLFFCEQKDYEKLVDSQKGYFEIDKKFRKQISFSQSCSFAERNDICKKLEIKDKKTWFYHPVQFIFLLNHMVKSNEYLKADDSSDKVVLETVEFIDDEGKAITEKICKYVNLPDDKRFIDEENIKGSYQLTDKIKCKVSFNKTGRFKFKLSLNIVGQCIEYSQNEQARARKQNLCITSSENHETFVTDPDGKKIIEFDDCNLRLGQAGGNKFKLSASYNGKNVESLGIVETWRVLYINTYYMQNSKLFYKEIISDIAECFNKGFLKLIFKSSVQIPDLDCFNYDKVEDKRQNNETQVFLQLLKNRYQVNNIDDYLINLIFVKNIYVKYKLKDPVKYNVAPNSNRAELIFFDGNDISFLNVEKNNPDSWYVSCIFKSGLINDKIGPEKIKLKQSLSTAGVDSVVIDLSSIDTSKGGSIECIFNFIESPKNGIKYGDSNNLFIATELFSKSRQSGKIIETCKHEIGHIIGLVPDGNKLLDKGKYWYYGKGHLGNHCFSGCDENSELYTSYAIANKADCLMFGQEIEKEKTAFCSDCLDKIKKTYLANGVPV